MITPIIQILIGLALLSLGAESLIRGSAALALRLGITPLVIGLTIVAFGTSSPEIVVSVQAAFKGDSALALGNVIGSNVLNILFVLGLAATISPMPTCDLRPTDVVVMIGSAAIILPLMRRGFQLTRWEGAFLLAGYVGYLYSLMPY